ncbi:MAG: ADP-ribosylglycohydrolase family protein [Poseidonibacter sp.]
MSTNNTKLKQEKVKAAIINLFIGDALSMPVHWFYNRFDIIKTFGINGITKMQAAPALHPSSIMNLHSTTSGGRKNKKNSQEKQIVGDVILKGKAHLWGRVNGHYHHGMSAGENTLNAWCAKWLITSLIDNPSYSVDSWAKEYISLMTSETANHPDTYAESYHREFFSNYIEGKDISKCGAITHDTPSMGALVTVAPLAFSLLSFMPLNEVVKTCQEHVFLTHPDEGLMYVVKSFVVLIDNLLNKDLKDEEILEAIYKAACVIPKVDISKLIASNKEDSYVLGQKYSLACYITDSWPSVCFLAAKYYKDSKKALLINTNLGGENAHRGSVLGVIIGLASGKFDEEFYKDLAQYENLNPLINEYLKKFYP